MTYYWSQRQGDPFSDFGVDGEFCVGAAVPGNELAQLTDYLARNLFSFIEPDVRTEVGGLVTQLADKIYLPANGGWPSNARSIDPSHAFAQPSNGKQLAAIAANAGMAGQLAANFNGGPFYASTLAPGAWKFSYDGTGYLHYLVYNPNSIAAATAGWSTFTSPAAPGSWIFPALTNGKPQTTAGRTGAAIYDSGPSGQGAAVLPGTLSYLGVRAASADPADMVLSQRGAPVYTAPDGLTFASTASAQTMLLGALNGAGANPLNALVGGQYIANKADTALQTAIERYIELKFGLKRQETILAIGDSQMVNMDPVFKSVRPALSGKELTFSNSGVPGSTSTTWAVGSTNYNNAKSAFLGAKTTRLPAALLIELGTNDAKDPTSGSAGSTWTTNVTAMIAQIRTDLGLPNLPVVLVVMPATVPSNVPGLPGETFSNWGAIRAAQLALSIPGVTKVQAPDGPYVDNLHLDASANAVLAALMSAQIA